MVQSLTYYCDDRRHLVCVPYCADNLHAMAKALGIKRCWFHTGQYPHYDIPLRDITRIKPLCTVITSKELLAIIKGTP